jgi:hypothetical protein
MQMQQQPARNKTHRRRQQPTVPSDIPGPFQSDTVARSTEESLDALFATESHNTFQQPWNKLDRGARLDRLRKFVNSCGPPDLSPAERSSLLTAVLQAFELRQLNSKTAVEYDPLTASVLSVRGLRTRIAPSGLRTFRVDSASATTTAKAPKKKVTGGLKPADTVVSAVAETSNGTSAST